MANPNPYIIGPLVQTINNTKQRGLLGCVTQPQTIPNGILQSRACAISLLSTLADFHEHEVADDETRALIESWRTVGSNIRYNQRAWSTVKVPPSGADFRPNLDYPRYVYAINKIQNQVFQVCKTVIELNEDSFAIVDLGEPRLGQPGFPDVNRWPTFSTQFEQENDIGVFADCTAPRLWRNAVVQFLREIGYNWAAARLTASSQYLGLKLSGAKLCERLRRSCDSKSVYVLPGPCGLFHVASNLWFAIGNDGLAERMPFSPEKAEPKALDEYITTLRRRFPDVDRVNESKELHSISRCDD